MKTTITIFMLFISIFSYAQSFEELINSAYEAYAEQNYEASAETFDKAFDLREGRTSDYYNAACSWALAGNTEQAFTYLEKAADKGWHNLSHIGADKDLLILHESPRWLKLLEKIEANKADYEKDFNKPLQSKLEEIYIKDQLLRQLYKDAEEKFGKDSEEMKYYWDLVSEMDSINEVKVVAIIDEYGWVGKSVVGGKANSALWLVIQHAPLEMQEKYLPQLRESVKKGESSGNHLALLEDRIQMRNGLPQTYGSQIRTDQETGKQYVYEIKDPEYVNQRRKSVGLGPIEEYLQFWGIEWTIKQKEK